MRVMWRYFKQTANELARDKPGERFTQYYRRHRGDGRESRLARTLYMVLGFGLTLIGAVLIISPVVPGFFLIIPGLAIVAVRSRWAAQLLDRMECFVRGMAARVRRRRA